MVNSYKEIKKQIQTYPDAQKWNIAAIEYAFSKGWINAGQNEELLALEEKSHAEHKPAKAEPKEAEIVAEKSSEEKKPATEKPTERSVRDILMFSNVIFLIWAVGCQKEKGTGHFYGYEIDDQDKFAEKRRKDFPGIYSRGMTFRGILTWDDKVVTKNGNAFSSEERREPGIQFKARLFGIRVGDYYLLEMVYLDYTHDDRSNTFVGFYILMPGEEIERVVPVIKKNPKLMIDLFHKAFPGHDNSDGRLTIQQTEFDV